MGSPAQKREVTDAMKFCIIHSGSAVTVYKHSISIINKRLAKTRPFNRAVMWFTYFVALWMAYQKDAGQVALERNFILCKFNSDIKCPDLVAFIGGNR